VTQTEAGTSTRLYFTPAFHTSISHQPVAAGTEGQKKKHMIMNSDRVITEVNTLSDAYARIAGERAAGRAAWIAGAAEYPEAAASDTASDADVRKFERSAQESV